MSDEVEQTPFRLYKRTPEGVAEKYMVKLAEQMAEMEQLRDDLNVLGHVGRMYLDALDADPENEMLTLGEAYRVSAVREAVERWEATADVASGRDVGAEGGAG